MRIIVFCLAFAVLVFQSTISFAQQTKVITSASKNISTQDGVIFASQDRTTSWKITKQTLRGGMQDAVELIHVDNGKLKISIIPTRGMSIYRVESANIGLGWNSPVKQIVHPKHIDLNDHGGLGWLKGFNEMMVRCGLSFAGHPGEDDGKMLTLHGRVGNIPADEVSIVIDDTAPYRIRVRGKVEEKMFKFGVFELWTELSTVPGSNSFQISDRLINKSEYDKEYQIIYHSNFGRPILGKGAQFVAPIKTVAPFDDYAAKDLDTFGSYLGPTQDYGEQVYCLTMNADDKGMTRVMLHNAEGDRGVAMHYAVSSLPHFTLWKNTDTETDGYVTGLEPGSGYPYNRSVERAEGRVPKISAGGEIGFFVEFSVLSDAESIRKTHSLIDQIQGDKNVSVSTIPPRQNE